MNLNQLNIYLNGVSGEKKGRERNRKKIEETMFPNLIKHEKIYSRPYLN